MHGVIALHQRRRIGSGQFAAGVFQYIGWQIGVESRESLSQPSLEHDVTKDRIAALSVGFTDRNRRTVSNGVAKCLEPPERGILDHGFGKASPYSGTT